MVKYWEIQEKKLSWYYVRSRGAKYILRRQAEYQRPGASYVKIWLGLHRAE